MGEAVVEMIEEKPSDEAMEKFFDDTNYEENLQNC